ncbi:MAG: hypothetical protein ACD_12C00138G0001 [uncultured bacterium]|nr:MAG: hypothetical protein ACD_12C00138G0001 [uncultured bacterium]
MSYKPYQNLKSYQQAQIIYDFTVEFTKRYIKSLRTKEQMDQAARSGEQNIAEGSEISQVSKKSEIKLLGISRGSLEELLNDYKAYLRQNKLELWPMESQEARQVRNLVYEPIGNHMNSYASYESYLTSAENAANAMVCLINQTNMLLDKQIASRKADFLEKGGFSESLYKDRAAAREKQMHQLDDDRFVPRNR